MECENFSILVLKVEFKDFAIISWVFSHTNIPKVISCQKNGEMLHVHGFGSFHVEWRMMIDPKTIKCMYNMSKGATRKTP